MTRYIGSYVRLLKLSDESYGEPTKSLRKTAVGRICRIAEPYEGTSENGLTIRSGDYLVDYAAISRDGVSYVRFYVNTDDIENVEATEEMIILYSADLWQLIRPFGQDQDTETFAKLVKAFGLIGD